MTASIDWVCATCGGRIGRDQTPRWFHWYRRDLKPRHRIVPMELSAYRKAADPR